ncbi:hypothetical protein BDN70DRAFT_320312 [Pholiota conissans]|uniref:Uncharacterized protein n=1 Tax=Pholiota conissans TaxID=109636 RepID=A0A9P5YTN8_9AGAR|nr:hypothetical protein BDN70DRAFT_320312 [Pholiota conissans]
MSLPSKLRKEIFVVVSRPSRVLCPSSSSSASFSRIFVFRVGMGCWLLDVDVSALVMFAWYVCRPSVILVIWSGIAAFTWGYSGMGGRSSSLVVEGRNGRGEGKADEMVPCSPATPWA